ncbi:MAG: hypothetical protein L6308_06535 [Candidatus Omnitrophica bacterium]|nr:hypothetical protein [Candidatus Omnitrophota bacterium]
MSIINEALKKTEQSIHKNSIPEIPKSATKPYIIYILILIAGLFLSNFVFVLLRHKTETAVTVKKSPDLTDQPVKEIKTIPPISVVTPGPTLEENKTPQANFVLSGIFFSDNDSYALVNNKIVRENDSVDGARVKTITANTVELDSGGMLITLATQR